MRLTDNSAATEVRQENGRMTPREYEFFVAEELQRRGFHVEVQRGTGDWGVDLFASRDGERIAVQVKMYGDSSRPVNRAMLMELEGARRYFDCTGAALVTNGRVLPDARKVAEKLGIALEELEPAPGEYGKTPEPEAPIHFDDIWGRYIMPLAGQTLTSSRGDAQITTVDWSGVQLVNTTGNERFVRIEIFREVVNRLLETGMMSREEINDNYVGRASSAVCHILAQVPFFHYEGKPGVLRYRRATEQLDPVVSTPAAAAAPPSATPTAHDVAAARLDTLARHRAATHAAQGPEGVHRATELQPHESAPLSTTDHHATVVHTPSVLPQDEPRAVPPEANYSEMRAMRASNDPGSSMLERARVALAGPGRHVEDPELAQREGPGIYAIYAAPGVWEQLGLGRPPDDRPLYVGKAEGARDIRQHFRTGSTGSSTLRRSIAALLRNHLGLQARPRNPANPRDFNKYALNHHSDIELTEWMRKNLRMALWVRPQGEEVAPLQDRLLQHWQPPLNGQGVTTPWSAMLSEARKAMTNEARDWRP